MKILFGVVLFLCTTMTIQAQVLIDRVTATNTSVALEFGSQTRGILLEPSTLPASPSAGTLVFDDTTGSLRLFNGTSWNTPINGGTINTVIDYTTTGEVIINAAFSSANGAFIIENSDRAMVLPKLSNGVLSIKNPVAGLFYYDTVLKTMMVYNGNTWVAY